MGNLNIKYWSLPLHYKQSVTMKRVADVEESSSAFKIDNYYQRKTPYKKNISNKESNRPRAAFDLTRMEKGEVISDNTASKSYLPLFVENYYWAPQYEFKDLTVRAGKNSERKGFVTRFLNCR